MFLILLFVRELKSSIETRKAWFCCYKLFKQLNCFYFVNTIICLNIYYFVSSPYIPKNIKLPQIYFTDYSKN